MEISSNWIGGSTRQIELRLKERLPKDLRKQLEEIKRSIAVLNHDALFYLYPIVYNNTRVPISIWVRPPIKSPVPWEMMTKVPEDQISNMIFDALAGAILKMMPYGSTRSDYEITRGIVSGGYPALQIEVDIYTPYKITMTVVTHIISRGNYHHNFTLIYDRQLKNGVREQFNRALATLEYE